MNNLEQIPSVTSPIEEQNPIAPTEQGEQLDNLTVGDMVERIKTVHWETFKGNLVKETMDVLSGVLGKESAEKIVQGLSAALSEALEGPKK